MKRPGSDRGLPRDESTHFLVSKGPSVCGSKEEPAEESGQRILGCLF